MDYEAFKFINQFAGQYGLLDTTMKAIAGYGPLLFALPLLYLWFFRKTDGKKAALLALASMAVALLAAQVIGHIYFRPRPFAAHEVNLLVERSSDPSFPSDHATFSFAIAWLVWFADRRAGWLSLALAVLIAVSRVFIGTHFPLDVVGGALVGLVSAFLVWKLRNILDPVTSFIIMIARRLRLA